MADEEPVEEIVLTTKEVEPNTFTRLLVDKPEVIALSSVGCTLFWLILIPIIGAPVVDTGGDAFRASSGLIPEKDFTFKAGLRASVSTGIVAADGVCADTDFATFPGVGEAGKVLLETVLLEGAARDVSNCAGIMDALATLAPSFTCDDDLAIARPVLNATLGLPLPEDVSSLRVICAATCPAGCGDGSGHGMQNEHVYQSKVSNVLQMTFESFTEDDETDNVLTVKNMQRICDAEQRVLTLRGMNHYCLKVPAGATDCNRLNSLCRYMQARTQLEYSITLPHAAVPGAQPHDEDAVKLIALGMLMADSTLAPMDMYTLFSYLPPTQLPSVSDGNVAANGLRAQLAGQVSEDGVLSGSSPYGVCTDWTLTMGDTGYSSVIFTGCSIPDGTGPMVTVDSQVQAIANRLKNSDDVNTKTAFLTKAFLDGLTDKVTATKMTTIFGVPYNVPTFDAAFGLTAPTRAACIAKFTEEEVSQTECQGITSYISNQMRPAHKFEGPTSLKYGANGDKISKENKELATKWWYMLECGRTLLDFNAQCVEDLNKKEQQFLFDTFADDVLFPELNDKMLAGESPYDHSGPDGELRIYWSEFSRMVQTYFDTLLGGDGAKASLAMLFSYIYICFHTRDFGLSTVGMIHIMMSIPVSLAVYIGPLGFNRFNTLCPLGIFVILGIGADDVFIMVDCWKQSLRYFPEEDLHRRMAWTWVRGSHAMLTTTMTTAVAFFSNIMSPIAPIAVFGVFSGLLVVVNYVYVITWFPAMIIMKEKKMLGYYIPAYCGCLLAGAPVSYLKWKSANEEDATPEGKSDEEDKAPAVQVSQSELMSRTEKWFYDVYAPALDKVKIPVVIVGSIMTLIFFVFAVQLKASEEAAQFLPSKDPMQRNIDLSSNPEKKVFSATEQQQFINIFMGASEQGIDRDMVPFIPLDANQYGTFLPAANFPATMSDPAAIDQFTTICARLRDLNDPSGIGGHVRRIDNPEGEVFCVLDGFKTWLADDMGLTYPDVLTTGCVAPCVRTEHFAKLIADYSEFLLRTIGISVKGQTSFIPSFGNTPSDTLRFDFQTTVPCGDRSSSVPMEQCRPLLMVQLYANATFKFNSPGAEVQPAIDAMDDMLTAVNGQGPAVAKHTAVRYVGIETEGALSGSAVKGTVGSMVLALVCILAATNNYLVTLWSMLVIMFIVIAVVGTMVMIGWTLGVIESICITIVVGLSVDYTIHLCHIFASSTAETRFEAGRDSLASMGVSVINAAITTLGSAVVLMLAYIVFFRNFGIFVFMNIFYSVFYAFAYLMAILMWIGPIQGSGTIYRGAPAAAEDAGGKGETKDEATEDAGAKVENPVSEVSED